MEQKRKKKLHGIVLSMAMMMLVGGFWGTEISAKNINVDYGTAIEGKWLQ